VAEAGLDVGNDDALDAFYTALLDDDPAALYDRAPCGYLSTLPDGTIVKVNATFLSLTGHRREDLVGRRTFAQLLTPGGRIYHETHYAPMLQMQGSAREIALEVVCADGNRLPVLVNAALERDPEGNPVVVRAAVFDATDRRLYERELLRAKERAEESERRATALAQTLQRTLIPPTFPSIPGLDVVAAFRPASGSAGIGGDFYDIFEVASGDWVVTVGDVEGKGVEAAVVTALARHTIRAAAVNQHEPSEILTTLNTVLLADRCDRFCTVALVRLHLDGDGWTATTSCGGHPPPVLCRAGEPPVPIECAGSLLGVVPTPTLSGQRLRLLPGDTLVLYTDGVTEARGPKGFFGEDRLRETLDGTAASASERLEHLLDAVLDFQAGEQGDDIAIVAIGVPTATG
jgi:sigma-B regulation protein RsbU (phosphoserine phosphatase)